jgi:hypothetical protein
VPDIGATATPLPQRRATLIAVRALTFALVLLCGCAPALMAALGVAGCGGLLGIPSDEKLDAPDACARCASDADVDSSQSGDVKDDDAIHVGVGQCNLANSTVCRGQCPGNDTTCGCLPDPGTQTTNCGITGTGGQGSACSSDTDCAPGYGCVATIGICAHWCRPTTACPINTTCQANPFFTSNGETFHYCY